MSPSRRSRIPAGWLPRQHGAWFMLALPVVVGLLLRRTDGVRFDTALVPLVACWISGYLAFNAATVLLKTPAARRRRAIAPTLTYTLVTAAFGGAAALLAGPGLLGWAVPFGPLVAGALGLAAIRHERSVASGALTALAASMMTLVVRFVLPAEALAAWPTPVGVAALVRTGLVFGYLFGTVLYVKTMIRERARLGWLGASVGWHATVLVAVLGGTALGTLGAAWPVFFAVATVRAWLMPALARRRPIRPLFVGIVEIGLVAALITVSALV